MPELSTKLQIPDEIKRIPEINKKINKYQLVDAYNFIKAKHSDQKRKSGEPYYTHPIEVAIILAAMQMDNDTIIAALLHDIVEDTDTSIFEIKEKFSEDISRLVDGLSKITKYHYPVSKSEIQANYFRKMLLTSIDDIRILIIKLADRLHNMRTIKYLNPEKQKKIAKETRDIYIPLAERIGIASIKSEMEDYCFEILEPEIFGEILEKMNESKTEREIFIHKTLALISSILNDNNIKYTLTGRAKNLWSIFTKMTRRKVPFSEIYDLFALRVVTETVGDCYQVLGIVHSNYKPIQERMKDYIANPKKNGYQSLHTVIEGDDGRKIEIQIRTTEMDKKAEEGIAAHWRYKERSESTKAHIKENILWLRKFLKNVQEDLGPAEFLSNLKSDLSVDTIYVFTPDDEIVSLTRNSTALDFAFAVHSEIGAHSVSAKVNDKLVPLSYKLDTGDKVSINTVQSQNPKDEWLHFVQTSKARTFIKNYLKTNIKDSSILNGKRILMEKLDELELTFDNLEDALVKKFGKIEELYINLGSGLTSPIDVIKAIATKEQFMSGIFDNQYINNKVIPLGVTIENYNDEAVVFADCCQPVPGDPIKGILLETNTIEIHRENCGKQEESLSSLPVEWDHLTSSIYKTTLVIEASINPSSLFEIGHKLADYNIEILSFDLKRENKHYSIEATFMIENTLKLNFLIDELSKLHIVKHIRRTGD